jgi:anti-anti-sigma factor
MPESSVTTVKPHDQVLLLEVCRRTLDDTSTQALVDEVYTAAGQHPQKPIVLDFGKVKFAPSVALGSLVQLSKSFQIDGRRVALVGVDRRLRDSIRVTRLDKILEIYGTANDVISAR